MNWGIKIRCLSIYGLLLVFSTGCGDSSESGRLPIFGTIANFPVTAGSISFVPAPGHQGPGAVASIDQGKYRFDASNGPVAGPHIVIITPTVTKQAPTGNTATGQPRLPDEWRLQADVPAKPPYQIDLQIDVWK